MRRIGLPFVGGSGGGGPVVLAGDVTGPSGSNKVTTITGTAGAVAVPATLFNAAAGFAISSFGDLVLTGDNAGSNPSLTLNATGIDLTCSTFARLNGDTLVHIDSGATGAIQLNVGSNTSVLNNADLLTNLQGVFEVYANQAGVSSHLNLGTGFQIDSGTFVTFNSGPGGFMGRFAGANPGGTGGVISDNTGSGDTGGNWLLTTGAGGVNDGGSVYITLGAGAVNGGGYHITTGASTSAGNGGDFSVSTGGTAGGQTGFVTLNTGNGTISGSIQAVTGDSDAGSGSVTLHTGSATTNDSGGIFVSTGTGQANSGAFSVTTGSADSAGGITLIQGNSNDQTSSGITIQAGGASNGGESAGDLRLYGGAHSSSANAGGVLVVPGLGVGSAPNGRVVIGYGSAGLGGINIKSGLDENGNGSELRIETYQADGSHVSGHIVVKAADNVAPGGNQCGNVTLESGTNTTGPGNGGYLTLQGGYSTGAGFSQAQVRILGGAANDGPSGDIEIRGGTQNSSGQAGGNITIAGGANASDGTGGGYIFLGSAPGTGAGNHGGLEMGDGSGDNIFDITPNVFAFYNLQLNDPTRITDFTVGGVIRNITLSADTGALSLQANGTNRIQTDLTGIGFFAATPVARPTAAGSTAGFTANAGVPVVDASTFTGGVGATAYTVDDIVAALKNLGLIAS